MHCSSYFIAVWVAVIKCWCCVIGMDSFTHGQKIYTDESGQMSLYTPYVNKALHTHLNTTYTDLGAPLENQVYSTYPFMS